jgi:8-oxo-dGTP pyrophosphatase MutT (NUDIX family)
MTEQIETWKIKRSETVADCKIFKVRRDYSIRNSDGAEFPFYCLENGDWVNIIPLTTAGEVVLIEQFRHGIEEITLEIPGGMVDNGEDARIAAERELVEETGYVPRETILLGKSRPNPAIQNNWVYHYLAIDCEKHHEPEFDATESVVSKLVPFEEVQNLLKDGKITHSLVITAFHWLSLREK